MYLALIVLSMLVFLALCLVGLFTLIRQAVADPPFTAPHFFIEARLPAATALSAAAPSEDAERGACGEGCA
jgi:hypothetical protein